MLYALLFGFGVTLILLLLVGVSACDTQDFDELLHTQGDVNLNKKEL